MEQWEPRDSPTNQGGGFPVSRMHDKMIKSARCCLRYQWRWAGGGGDARGLVAVAAAAVLMEVAMRGGAGPRAAVAAKAGRLGPHPIPPRAC